jgi:hypothetical protein
MREHRAPAVDATALLYERLEWLASQRSELENLRARVREAERKAKAPYPKWKGTAAGAPGAPQAKASAHQATRPAL